MVDFQCIRPYADAFGVSLDYLVGEGQNVSFDKKTLQRLQEIEAMGNDRKAILFDLIDTYIRDFKTRQTYAYQNPKHLF